jgi:hypothetical protein
MSEKFLEPRSIHKEKFKKHKCDLGSCKRKTTHSTGVEEIIALS